MGNGNVKTYKDLGIWQKGVLLAKDIYELTEKYPQKEKFGLINQMRRSAVSIPANIAEGWARTGTKEFIHFLHISNGSLAELQTFMVISRELKYSEGGTDAGVEKQIEELQKMIYAMIRSLSAKPAISEIGKYRNSGGEPLK